MRNLMPVPVFDVMRYPIEVCEHNKWKDLEKIESIFTLILQKISENSRVDHLVLFSSYFYWLNLNENKIMHTCLHKYTHMSSNMFQMSILHL